MERALGILAFLRGEKIWEEAELQGVGQVNSSKFLLTTYILGYCIYACRIRSASMLHKSKRLSP
jgi:hypothetical protein